MQTYLSFVALCALLAIAPGPDSFLTLRTTVVAGQRRGLTTTAGIAVANTVQGVLAATGLGAILAASEPVFQTIRWLGVAYLTWLGLQALRAAIGGDGGGWNLHGPGTVISRRKAFRQGFVCNITNPKVLAFNLAVLPQFVGGGASVGVLLTYALTLMVVGAIVLLVIVWAAGRAAAAFERPGFRRSVDGVTGVVMIGFAGLLALEH